MLPGQGKRQFISLSPSLSLLLAIFKQYFKAFLIFLIASFLSKNLFILPTKKQRNK